ncbi:MAG: hypothetical protein H6839_12850 [Planctomycetes bacterium]|nr:hypothetical protein [Planctomycetota bacterium]
MTDAREQLDERYLEAQLRDELGPQPDLSERVLRAVYAKPRRVVPPPRRVPRWKPLAAAAGVLIAAGLATYSLVNFLPEHFKPQRHTEQAERPKHPLPDIAPRAPHPKPEPQPAPNDSEDTVPEPEVEPAPGPQPTKTHTGPFPVPDFPRPPKKPDDQVSGDDPEGPVGPLPKDPGLTDPPESWPDPKKPKYADPNKGTPTPAKRAVLVAAWKGDSIRISRQDTDGKWTEEERVKSGEAFEICAGDRIKPKGSAEFTLVDGTLLRLDGEITFGGEESRIAVALNDGALYADTAAPLTVTKDEIVASITGVAVVEERLHGMDVFCVGGRVSAGEDFLMAGFQARLEKDGFGRDRNITWQDVQREFRFLKDTPQRLVLCESMDESPKGVFGGEVADGMLAGDTDSDTGIGFYLREPHELNVGDVVRFRVRLEKSAELILQFGTVADDNWRNKLGSVRGGEWIEMELPLAELFKTLDPSEKARPGMELKFFQLHPEDARAHIEIDWVEIVHRP